MKAKAPSRCPKLEAEAGVTSTMKLGEYPVAWIAPEDDFGAALVARKGTIPKDVKLGF